MECVLISNRAPLAKSAPGNIANAASDSITSGVKLKRKDNKLNYVLK